MTTSTRRFIDTMPDVSVVGPFRQFRFDDAELEAAFIGHQSAETREGVRAMLTAATVLMVLGGFPEFTIVDPFKLPTVVLFRYGLAVPALLIAIGLTFTDLYRQWMDWIVSASVVITAFCQMMVTSYYPDSETIAAYFGVTSALPRNEGMFGFIQIFNLGGMLAAVASGALRTRSAAILCLFVIGMSPLCYWLYEPDIVAVGYILFLTAPATAMTVYGSRQMDRLRREEFWQQQQIDTQRKRSEKLLLEILPPSIARRLRASSRTIADAFNDVSVLFTDIVDFTGLARETDPVDLIQLLGRLFSDFDDLTTHLGLEKIKTIGDAYMVAGGAPESRQDHLPAMADLALAMQEVASGYLRPSGMPLQLRTGIHTGPAIAGVIGHHRLAYDLWGDTVNTASRMESHSEPGRIQVTNRTYELLRHRYIFEQRGVVEIKGKGDMKTWFLVNRKTA